ncbi:MAG: FtsX-like permease family protein [Anaerolineales bacterium]|jgi:putative ABC transport system permease protein|nr:FtsX-like permease family protein [Anaerolineales bacterium]
MRPRWRKIFLDLFDNWTRTLLVVFSIAVGVFSIGVISGAYVIIKNDMSASYAANKPANIELRMSDFDRDFLSSIENARGIGEVEGRRVLSTRARREDSSKWTALDMVAVDDFEENKINLLTPISGSMIPAKNEVVVERKVLQEFKIAVGESIVFELVDGSTKSLKVVGIAQDPTTGAGDFLAPPFVYISMDSLRSLRQPDMFNRVYATVSENQNDGAHIRAVGADLKDRIEKSGETVARSRTALTNEHPLASTVNAILGILLALGVLIVFLSSSLIANTLAALLNQHLRHIGVMKLVGGRRNQVFAMYLVLILTFGLLALAIAVPAGGLGAYELANYIASMLSFTILGKRIVPLAFYIQIAVGILVPLLAGFGPVLNGSRITVLRAISGDSTSDGGGQEQGDAPRESAFDRSQQRVTAALARRGIHFPRPLLISLRNTFRRKSRLLLTLFTLTMGGAIFIGVFNVRVTLFDYMDNVGRYFVADVTLDFDQPYRLNEIEKVARQVPGVVDVEGWAFAIAEVLYPDGTVAENLTVLAPPAGSKMVDARPVSGRWLQAGDTRAIAVTEGMLRSFPNLKAGDFLRVKIGGQEQDWEVVGIFQFIDREGLIAYGTYEHFSREANLAGRSVSYRVVTDRHDEPYQAAMSEALDKHFRDAGYKLRQARPGLSALNNATESLDILVIFLLIMALLTAIVGAMGLTGTMGMNVLERTREIGIMRAIGAGNAEVMRMVIVEGVVIGSISWVLGIFLAIPLTYLLSLIVSLAVFETPIRVVFTPTGYIIWLGIVLLLSALASVVPARNAARLTIREVLAYE